ncbi:MAG: DegT/DnrJ/EryC1/StrS family aminotransferase [bacterium]|nr:DegT/DnrJ/EryC1/StrS family aminotransferase [bacterium]
MTEKKSVPFGLPYITKDEIDEVIEALRSGWISTGPKSVELEEKLREYIGTKYSAIVSSCTAALHLALCAYDIKEGDEVITSPYTFIATTESILYTGAKPVFVDIHKDTLNIDPAKIEKAITKRTKAIVPVHIAGHPCEMDEIMKIAKKHNLIVIEDAAHAFGTYYKSKKIGTIGDATCFSFYATKNLTTGEGGMITTNNKKIAEKIKLLRLHGMSRDAWKRYSKEGSWYYEILTTGYKYNISDIHSALGIQQLKKFEKMQKMREKIVNTYDEAFSKIKELQIPVIKDYSTTHAYHLYIIKIVPELLKIDRTKFIELLRAENIGTGVHFIPLHLMPFYKQTFGFKKGDFPNAEWAYERTISLPLYPGLTSEDVKYIIKKVKDSVAGNSRRK